MTDGLHVPRNPPEVTRRNKPTSTWNWSGRRHVDFDAFFLRGKSGNLSSLRREVFQVTGYCTNVEVDFTMGRPIFAPEDAMRNVTWDSWDKAESVVDSLKCWVSWAHTESNFPIAIDHLQGDVRSSTGRYSAIMAGTLHCRDWDPFRNHTNYYHLYIYIYIYRYRYHEIPSYIRYISYISWYIRTIHKS